jgi:hypothetical protein
MNALANPDQHVTPGPAAIGPGAALRRFMLAQWRKLTRRMRHSYRPEQHYMRGCGPKCQAKQALTDRH